MINIFYEDSVDFFGKDIYEHSDKRTFLNYARAMGEEVVRYYDRSSSADYRAYTDKRRTQRSGSGSETDTLANRDGNQRSGTLEETQSNEIAPEKAPSEDGAFFDGEIENKKEIALNEGVQYPNISDFFK